MGDRRPEASWVLTVYGLPQGPQIILISMPQLGLSLKQLLENTFPALNFEGKLVEWKGVWCHATMSVKQLLSSPTLFLNYHNGKCLFAVSAI